MITVDFQPLYNKSLRSTSLLAHEVRNPLTSINLSAEMLRSAITNPELRPYLDIIVRGSARINQLMNELIKNQVIEEIEKAN
jgi:signal transduction histidine kinase